ncbi:MAG: DUF2203 family protein [Candidatus Omnitrophica bacterium]|nr:DUF2203 family protein [Candidatus Omnitrophota bacterium]
MSVEPKAYTLEETNALVSRMETILNRLMDKKEDYDRLHDQLFMHELLVKNSPHGPYYDPGKAMEKEARNLDHSLTNGFTEEFKQIQSLGCFVRDLERGIVDFLGFFEGRKVYFCWKRGEKKVQYFHELTEDCRSRQPID